jgi:hypothetical protein
VSRHADAVLAQQVEGHRAVGGGEHGHALAPEDLGQRLDDGGLVVDHQDQP